jgi:cytochrome d ubiquinol oxidase subunit I
MEPRRGLPSAVPPTAGPRRERTVAVSALDLARWQFGITTVFHYLFVPLTIGLSIVVAIMQTMWHRTDDATYLRMTKFFGKLLLINFAVGVVTGIVQEFQFGMNWSNYSRMVGDVFGAPLAMEALVAFFLESTFLGLWIFGWGRLSRRVHLATIWAVAIGSTLSASFIIAANSWMQHPVGYRFNPETGRAELTSFVEVLTNSTFLVAYPHVILGALMTAGFVVLGISAWHLRKGNEVALFTRSARLSLVIVFLSGLLVALTGHAQAQLMFEQQPMKMASAEALWETTDYAPFSLFAVGDVTQNRNRIEITVPDGLSILATNSASGTVDGITELQARYEAEFGPGNYIPNLFVTYWTFRIMTGLGMVAVVFGFVGLWLMWHHKLERTTWYLRLALPAIALPYLANVTGWIFTEMGRQPWVVYGLQTTAAGVSPSVSAWTVAISLVGFTLLYGGLGAVDVWLMRKYAKNGPTEERTADEVGAALAY